MGRPPFRAETPEKLYKKIMIGEYEKIGSPYSQELSKFISKMMTQDQRKRPDCKQLLKMDKMKDLKELYSADKDALQSTTEDD